MERRKRGEETRKPVSPLRWSESLLRCLARMREERLYLRWCWCPAASLGLLQVQEVQMVLLS